MNDLELIIITCNKRLNDNNSIKNSKGKMETDALSRQNSLSSSSQESEEMVQGSDTESENNVSSIIGGMEMEGPDFSKFVCTICGDHATGTHYGILSCNGCRSFFRRTVLKRSNYKCKGETGSCSMTIDKRSFCKKCRFDKCVIAGMEMKMEGRQKQPACKRLCIENPTSVDNSIVLRSTQSLNINQLLESYYSSKYAALNCIEIPDVDGNVIASDWNTFAIGEHNATHAGLFMLVEWAKRIPGFKDLGMEDQIALLRSANRRYLWFHGALETIRSVESYEKKEWRYGWGKVKMPLESKAVDVVMQQRNYGELYEIAKTAFDKTVKPLKAVEVTDEELICFQALMILDPNAEGILDTRKVFEIRRNVQSVIMVEQTLNPDLMQHVMDLYHLLPAVDTFSFITMTVLRDMNFFQPVGQCSKLVDDLFFCY